MKKLFQRLLLITVLPIMLICTTSCAAIFGDENRESVSEVATELVTQPLENFTDYIVTAEFVNVRKEPSTESEILDGYYKNTLIKATSTDNAEWNKVKLSDTEYAFIFASFVSPISEADCEKYTDCQILDNYEKYGVIPTAYANIRALPTTSSDIIARYRKNDTIEILATTQNGWYVIDHNEITSYISPDAINLLSKNEYDSYMTKPSHMKFNEKKCKLIGTYSTYYSPYDTNRTYNLERAAKSMNGLVIKSNAMFNWCRDIGPCGKDEGYLESIEIVNDKYVKGYGGGICQVSSTLCASVISTDSDISFIDRNKHSIAQGYIPRDLDATVSYPDCNFIFKNTNPFSIMIQTKCNNGTLTINIYKIGNPVI